ncbi:Hint domain-containing protein [Flaviaesturariibacter terrae]
MNHEIDLQTAVNMTTLYRQNRDKMMAADFSGAMPFSETFDVSAFQTLLDQNPTQIRVYYGMNSDNSIHAIFVGVDDKGNDMFPGQPLDGKIMDNGMRCPLNCPPASALNQ